MSWFEVFRRKKALRHTFDDDDRETSKQIRQANQQLAQMRAEIQQIQMQRRLEMEKAELERLRDELRGDEDDNDGGNPMQQAVMMMLLKGLTPQAEAPVNFGNLQPQTVSTPPTKSPAFLSYTDEQIMDILDKLPKPQRKMLEVAPEHLIVAKMREMFNADDDSIARALAIIKGQ